MKILTNISIETYVLEKLSMELYKSPDLDAIEAYCMICRAYSASRSILSAENFSL
jgi:hypothetical protein